MADYNSLEDLNQWLARQKEMYEAGYISAKELAEAQEDHAAGIKGYTANLKQSMAQLGTSFKALGKDIYDGKQGASVFGDAMSSAGSHLYEYAKKFGPAGKAVALFTQATIGYINAANKQADLLFDSYKQISRAGMVGREAMKGVYDDMQDFGYTQEQLGEMGTFLAANSKDLARFGKSALGGAQQLQEIAGGLQQSDLRQQFFNLGMGVTDINQAGAGYLIQLGRLGKSTQATTAGAAEYIKEMETLTRLTGMQREEMEANRESLSNIDAYYATLQDLGPQQSKVMQDFMDMLTSKDPSGELTKGMAEVIGNVGIASSDAAMKLQQQTGFDVLRIKSKLLAGEYSNASEALADLGGSVKQNYQLQKDLSHTQSNYGLGLKVSTALMNTNKDAYNEVASAVADAAAGQNAETKQAAKIRDNQIKQAQNLQSFTNLGIVPATQAMEIFTDVIESLTSFLPGADKARQARAAKEYAAQHPTTSKKVYVGNQLYEEGSQEHKDALAGKPRAAAPAGAGGGGGGYVAPVTGETDLSGGGDEVDNSKKPAAGAGGLFKGQSLNGVSPALVAALTQAVTAYGKPITITSGVRSKEEQQKLYDDWISGKSKFPAAKPGNSKHERGNAVDISLADADALASGGYLKAAGLGRPVDGDPVHIQQVSAANGAILSGPSSGYKPNLTMHGTEAVVPLNTAAQQAAAGGMDSGILSAQLDKLDEMISLMKNQLGVSTRIMQSSV